MPDAPKQEAQQGQHRDLGGEGFGGRNADLRPGMHVHPAVAFTGDGAGDIITNAQRPVAFALAFAHGSECIRRFAALADGKNDGVFVHRHVAVAKFTGKFDLGGKVCQAFQDVFADHRGVARGAATGEDDALDIAQFRGRHVEAAELGGGFLHGKAPAHGVAQGIGLLKNFFEHVMGVISLAHIILGEFDLADLETGSAAIQAGDFKIVAIERNDVVVPQVNSFPRVPNDGAYVAGEKIFAFADAQDQRAAAPRADDHVSNIFVYDGDAISAGDFLERVPDGFHQPLAGGAAARGIEVFTDKVGQDLRIRLGFEMVPLGGELFLKRLVILDHAVVDQDKLAAFVKMRMRVLVGNPAVSGPAGMRDTDRTANRFPRD